MECKECKKITPDDKVLRCAICELPTCHTCSKLMVTAIRSVNLKSGGRLKYHCKNCDENFVIIAKVGGKISEDDIKSLLVDVLKTVREQNEKIEQMEKSIQELKDSKEKIILPESECKSKTYANIVKEPAIIVKPMKEQKSTETIKEIKSKIDPSKIAVGIDRIKEIKNGGVAINCSDKRSMDTMKEKVIEQLGDRYTIDTTQLKNPRVIVVGVEEKVLSMEDGDIINGIIVQNGFDPQEIKSFKIVKKIIRRNSGNIILEVQPNIMSRIVSMGQIHISFRTCKVYEHCNIIRCFNCGYFGHMRAECKKEKVCIKCFNKHDENEDCSENMICINCKNMNDKVNLKLDICHSIFDLNCPCYERIKQSICKKTKSFNK